MDTWGLLLTLRDVIEAFNVVNSGQQGHNLPATRYARSWSPPYRHVGRGGVLRTVRMDASNCRPFHPREGGQSCCSASCLDWPTWSTAWWPANADPSPVS